MKKEFPSFAFFQQKNQKDCGIACLGMIYKHQDVSNIFWYEDFVHLITANGISIHAFVEAAVTLGFTCEVLLGKQVELSSLPLPLVAYYPYGHFVVIYALSEDLVTVADPAIGICELSYFEFGRRWEFPISEKGIVIVCKPT